MSQKMRIGFDAKRAFQNKAGLGNYSRGVITGLAESFPENEYALFSPNAKTDLFSIPDSADVIVPESFFEKNFKSLWRSYKISDLVKEKRLDIYHGLSHELPIGIEETGVKTVVTIHDLIFIRHPEFYKFVDRKIYHRKYRHACQVADNIIAISKQTQQDLIQFLDADPSKIDVVYQSIKPIFYQKNSKEEYEETRRILHVPEEFILVPGTIEARKNLKTVLEAVIDAEIEIPLVVVGKPTRYMDELQPFVKKLGDRLILLHQVTDQQLSHLYQMAKLTVYVSIFEGFGLPVAEAQACGCPVVTSGVSSMPEAGGDAAYYVNPTNHKEIADAIFKIATNEQLRTEMIEKGLKNAERFHIEKQVQQLMNIYQNLDHARGC